MVTINSEAYTSALTPVLLIFLKTLAVLIAFIVAVGIVVGLVFSLFKRRIGRIRRRGSPMDHLIHNSIDLGFSLGQKYLTNYFSNRKNQLEYHESVLDEGQLLRHLKLLQPTEFEEIVAKLFSKLGYETRLNGGAGDGGIDIEMKKEGRRYVVQCKKFITQKVNPHDVRDFYGAMVGQQVDGKGFFVTTNIFTLDAEDFAKDKPIELIDGYKLATLIKERGVDVPEAERSEKSMSVDFGKCPSCGGELVERRSHQDNGSFIGCTNYPKCHFTKSA